MTNNNPISKQRGPGGKCASIAVLAVAGSALVTADATAADYVRRGDDVVGRNQTVFQRQRPTYDAKGLDIGGCGLTLFPSVDVSETYNDNIYATNTGEQDDFETVISPRLSLKSNWSRHSIAVNAFSRIHRFADIDSENNEEYGADASATLNLARDSSLTASGGYQRVTIDRGDPESSAGAASGPEQSDVLQGMLQYSHPFGRFRATLTGEVNDYSTVDSADPFVERTEYTGTFRLAYEISAALNAFVEPFYTMRRYDLQTPNRDVDVYGIGVGVAYDITGKLYGETQVGYYSAQFDSAAFSDSTSIFVRSTATWNISALTSIILGIERGNQASNVGNASSSTQSAIDLRLEHELARNITMALTGRYVHETFENQTPSRTDDYFTVGWLGNYLIDRHVSLFLQYQYQDRMSDISTSEYTDNRITFGIRGQI